MKDETIRFMARKHLQDILNDCDKEGWQDIEALSVITVMQTMLIELKLSEWRNELRNT